MLLVFFLLVIIFLFIIGKRNNIFGKTYEDFEIYNTEVCDSFNQPCMASREWTYVNGYYYPL